MHYSTSSAIARITIFLFTLIGFVEVSANPDGGNVVTGNTTITQNPNSTVINQNSQTTIINWNSFSIAPGESTHFNQPSANAIALNRVLGNTRSDIYGQLSANGKIILINPNGILFGKGSVVDVAGLIATTSNIKNEDFLAGNYQFIHATNPNAMIINEGSITAADHGLVALLAPGVANHGIIAARLGQVILASGQTFTLDFYGDQLIQFTVKTPNNRTGVAVENSGYIHADGGHVVLSATTAKNVLDNVINMDGVIEAKSIGQKNGEVILAGGDHGIVNVTGNIDVSGKNKNENGGKIKITGEKIGIMNNTRIDASGHHGGGEVLIGGDAHGNNKNIANAQYTYVSRNAKINADARVEGNGGKVIVWADNATQFYGDISAQGGSQSGHGGFVEVSGKEGLIYDGKVNTYAAHGKLGTLLLDPKFITIKEAGGNDYSPNNNNLFSNLPTTSITIKPSSINAQNANVILQANTDITVTDAIALSNPNIALTLQAGRSILVNNNISTNNGAITMIANDPNAQLANRTTGAGNITMKSGTTINAGNQDITLTIGNLAGGNPGAITLSNINTTGNLTVNSIGNITQNGAINVAGLSSFNAGNSNVTLTNANNYFNTIALTGNNVSINNKNAIALATTTVNGNLAITADGNITQTGALAVAGTANFSTGSYAITLDNMNNNFVGAVALTNTGNNNVTVNNGTHALILGNVNTGSGITALNAAGISQNTSTTVKLTSGGTLRLTAGNSNDITLNNSGNILGITEIISANNATLKNSTALILNTSNINNNLSVTTTGALTQIGALSVNGNASFSAGSNSITLNDNNNYFAGTVSLTNSGNNDVTVNNGAHALTLGNVNVGSGTTSLNAAGISQSTGTTVKLASNGILNLTTGTNDITLNNAGNNLSIIKINSARNVALNNNAALVFANSTISNNLIVTNVGNITQTGTLSVNGTANFTVGSNAITLTNTANNFIGAVALNTSSTSTNSVAITNSGLLTLDTSSLGKGTFTATGAGITQIGAITQAAGASTATFNAGTNNINLTNTNNNFTGGVALNNSGNYHATITNNTALKFATSNIGGNLIVNANGDITQSAALNVAGTASFTVGNHAITLTNTNNNFIGAVTLNTSNTNTNNVAITTKNLLTLDNVTLGKGTFTATGAGITQIGAITQAANADIATFNAGANSINLINPNNNLTGAVVLNNSGNNDVTVNNGAHALTLGNVNVGSGTTSLNAAGISQSTGTTVKLASGGTLKLDAATNDINLDNTGNSLRKVEITSAANAALRNNAALVFANSTISNNLNVITAGTITQTGALNVGGIANFNANTNNITLTNTDNTFNTVQFIGSNVNLMSKTSVAIDTSTIANTFTIISDGAISQTGSITANTLNTTSKHGTTLLHSNNQINTAQMSNSETGNLSLANNKNLTTTGITQTGNGYVSLNINGELNVSNGKSINSGNNALSIFTTNLKLNSTGKLNSGTANTTISTSGSIGLGNGTGTLSISNTELQNITAKQLILNAGYNQNINVDNVNALTTDITLNASNGLGNINFANNASTFKSLTANAGSSVNFDATLNTIENTTVNAQNVIGNLKVKSLSIGVTSANLTGMIDGLSGQAGADKITLTIPGKPGHLFFDGIDLVASEEIADIIIDPSMTFISNILFSYKDRTTQYKKPSNKTLFYLHGDID